MRKVIASCSVILMAGLALAACGGSSGSSKAGNTNPAGGATGGGATGGNSSGSDAFSKLVADAAKQKFKITYTSGSGDTQTYEQDGNGNSVYGSGGSQTFSSSSGTVSCHTGSDGKAECFKTSASSSVSPFLGFLNLGKSYVDALGGHFGHTSSKTIAGRSAKCVTFSASDFVGAAAAALGANVKGSQTYCVDKDTGVLLEISGTDDSGTATNTFTATTYEEPSDSDFTPPATPKTIPSYSIPSVSLPAGVTIPGGG